MKSDGTIREYDLSDLDQRKHVELLEKRLQEARAAGKPVEETPITSDQARFFKTKGKAFRELWGKRLSRGLTPALALQLKTMIDEFVINEGKGNNDGSQG
jgi:hypothetical protein